MAWHKGPLPKGTYFWGGVQKVGMGSGFYFADFCGDHAILCPSGERVESDQVAWFDNSLGLPPGVQDAEVGRIG